MSPFSLALDSLAGDAAAGPHVLGRAGGVTGHVVQAEADIANGLAGMILAGLPDTALREARGAGSAPPSSAAASSGPQRTITVGLCRPARPNAAAAWLWRRRSA